MKYDIVFVVLVYRNCADLEDFLHSLSALAYKTKVVVVNSYYDEETKQAAEVIAESNDCAFINVNNKGYGYGNNQGLEYALKNYETSYIILSNPDITVKDLDINKLASDSVTGPKIIAQRGRNQNPIHYKRNFFVLFFRYLFAKTGLLFFFLCAIFFNKLEKAIYRRLYKDKRHRVYALHGSFIIFPTEQLKKLGGKIFDERMFLFCEENHLAELSCKGKIKMVYDPSMTVLHKEDGSISLENHDHFKITRESLKVFFDNWRVL